MNGVTRGAAGSGARGTTAGETNGEEGWRSLGGILLAFTGVEALFADLGAFSMRAIQISWLCYCLPCLMLAYIGQAAYISVHPHAYSYPSASPLPPPTELHIQ